jgi:hypothetical protein
LNSRNYYTAYDVGWALYAESPLIAEDTNTYDNEPMQKYGMLQMQVAEKQGFYVPRGYLVWIVMGGDSNRGY